MELDIITKSIHCNAPTDPLKVDEEKILVKRYQDGDQNARKRLIESNIRFVVKVALQYRNQGLSLADLIQEGNLGLIEALEKFDLKKNCRLITYASWWIRLYIQRAIEQKARTVNLPINKLELLRKVRAYEISFEMQHGRKPYNDETAEGLGVEAYRIDDLENYAPSFQTLHCKDDDHPGMESVLIDEDYGDPREKIWMKEAKKRLNFAMSRLNEKEREVLTHRFNLTDGGKKKLSLRKVGKKMGLSAEGVRRIEEQAMTKLRRSYILDRVAPLFAN